MRWIIISILTSLYIPISIFAQTEQKLTASDAGEDHNFGYSISISGDFAVIGARLGLDDNGDETGAAYIYKRQQGAWLEHTKLLASDADDLGFFGSSVSIVGNRCIIGSAGDDELGLYAGAAYIFENIDDTWIEQQKLTASAGEAEDLFGHEVAIHGDIALVGVQEDMPEYAGAIYYYHYDGEEWIEQQRIQPEDIEENVYFSSSIHTDGNKAIVGAIWADGININSGAAYIYQFQDSIWVEEQRIYASDGSPADMFGCSVAVEGNLAVVGAFYYDWGSTDAGAIYIYSFNGEEWIQQQRIRAPDPYYEGYFGKSVSIYDSTIIVGAQSDREAAMKAGAAYVIEHDGEEWISTYKLMAYDAQRYDYFGGSVSISGSHVLVGAWMEDGDSTANYDSGAAYIYDLNETYPATLIMTPVNPPVVIPAEGGIFSYNINLYNHMRFPVDADAWLQVILPNGFTFPILGATIRLPASIHFTNDFEQEVPGVVPGAIYDFVASVGLYPNYVVASDTIEVIKLAGGQIGDDEFTWTAYGWDEFIHTESRDYSASSESPSDFIMEKAFPNPFNPVTHITIGLADFSQMKLNVYNALGQHVASLADGQYNAGYHSFEFDGSGLSSGIYFVQTTIDPVFPPLRDRGTRNLMQKVVLMK